MSQINEITFIWIHQRNLIRRVEPVKAAPSISLTDNKIANHSHSTISPALLQLTSQESLFGGSSIAETSDVSVRRVLYDNNQNNKHRLAQALRAYQGWRRQAALDPMYEIVA
jgi:hypothetical protein